MSKTQQWVIGAALAIILVIAAGWFLLVSPQRAKAAELRTQVATEQAASASLRTELAQLTAQAKQLPAKQAELKKFSQKIPAVTALPATIRALHQAATKAGVSLVSIAPTTPAPFVAAGKPAAAPAPAPAVRTGAHNTVNPTTGAASACQRRSWTW